MICQRSYCRFCNTELTHVFCDLNHQPPSNSFLTKAQLDEPEMTYPLKVMVCDKCWLVQLPEIAKAVDIFSDQYPYYSSQSPANISHAKEYCDMMMERFNPKSVLEIGSNDGYMLQSFQKKGCRVIGTDPAAGPAKYAREHGIETIVGFFNATQIREERKYGAFGLFDLICSINTLAHQPNLNDFVEGIKIALAPRGVTTHEFPHLMRLVEGNQFDTIYHEHYSYFSFATICEIFEKHLLSVFDVDEIPEHGGSLRIYAEHSPSCRQSEKVRELLLREGAMEMFSTAYYQSFQPKIDTIKTHLVRFLIEAKMEGKKICAYGAAAKASTLFNYCSIRKDLVNFVVDRSPHKIGKFFPGSHIAVCDETMIQKIHPDYILITAWNLIDEIGEQLAYAREWGCKFIVAVPNLEVL
jgi:SAM-dependent methyltransferase